MSFGLFLTPAFPVPVLLRLAVLAEALGFDHLWLPDHMLFPEPVPAPDPWTLLAAMAARTRRIGLGTAVSDPHRTHPAVMAQRLATLDQLSRGRVVLGLGTGEAMNLDPYGIPHDRRVGRTREFMHVLRHLLDSEEPLGFEGDFYRLRGARLTVRPFEGRRLPVFMAALGPKMQRLAGRSADGWLPVAVPARFYGETFGPVAEAARAAGRDPSCVARAVPLPVAVDLDGTLTDEALDRLVRPIALTLVWPEVLERLGLPWDPPAHLRVSYRDVDPSVPESLAVYKELCRWLPRDLMLRFVHRGRPESLRRVVAEYVEAGVTHFEVFDVSPDPVGSLVALATRVMPEFTGRRPTPAALALAAAMPVLKRSGLAARLFPSPFRRRRRS